MVEYDVYGATNFTVAEENFSRAEKCCFSAFTDWFMQAQSSSSPNQTSSQLDTFVISLFSTPGVCTPLSSSAASSFASSLSALKRKIVTPLKVT
jgi:hypothetical protein